MNNKIQELLLKQQQVVKNDQFEDILEISSYNEERFNEITSEISSVINKEVWQEFSFGSVAGKILGILRTLTFEYKNRNELCKKLGISPVLVDLYYQHAGNAPYYSKTGEIIPAKPMNIEMTRQIVFRTGTALNIIITDEDLNMINKEAEEMRNNTALQKAEDTKNNGGTFTQNVNVNISQNEQHMQSLLDA